MAGDVTLEGYSAMRNWLFAIALAVLALAFGSSAHAQQPQPILQRGYDANVDSANLTEGTLNTSNVAVSTFGMLFKLPVDNNVYAQPLYVPNVAISGAGDPQRRVRRDR